MSVLIKGIEMPKCCGDCRFMHAGVYDGREYPCYCYATPSGMPIKPSETDIRDGLCPLVGLPTPHGRLVEFIDVVVTDDEDTGTEEMNVGEAISAYLKMRSAPTVIEAEE